MPKHLVGNLKPDKIREHKMGKTEMAGKDSPIGMPKQMEGKKVGKHMRSSNRPV